MIIGLTGKNASGKGAVAEFLKTRGFIYFSLSDVLREELGKIKKAITRDNLTWLGNKLRNEFGPSILAEKILEELEEGQHYAIDSFRNPEEVQAFRRTKIFRLWSIEADPKIRFSRIRKRGREQDPESLADFLKQEEREAANADPTKQNLEACAKLADSHIKNNGPLQKFHDAITKACIDVLMHTPRPSWDEYFMRIAKVVASRSNCMKRKVAAVIVKNGRIISTGYNGTPRGIKNCHEGGCPRCNALAPSGHGLSECYCCHAEENAIVQAAYHGIRIKESTIYITFSPCLTCAKMIINAGIEEVVYNQAYPLAKDALHLLRERKIRIRELNTRAI